MVLILAGCASTPMLVTPTDEYYRGALVRLTDDERNVVKQGFSFRLDFSQAQFFEPMAEGSRRSTADIYEVQHLEYAEFFNANLTHGAERAIQIDEARVFTRAAMDTGIQTPVIAIVWRRNRNGDGISVRGRSGGEPYSIFSIGRRTTDPISVRSANIAFFAAFLKAAVALEKHLDSTAASADQ